MSRISLRELGRLERALERFDALASEYYPDAPEPDRGDDATETIRNASTALVYVRKWISYRQHNRRDPLDRAPGVST